MSKNGDGRMSNYKGMVSIDLFHHGRAFSADSTGLQFYYTMPNFATIGGPNTGSAHSSVLFMLECQVDAVIKHLVAPVLQKEEVDSVTIKKEAESRYMEWLGTALSETVWEKEHNAGSWWTGEKGYVRTYTTAHIAGWADWLACHNRVCTTLYPGNHVSQSR